MAGLDEDDDAGSSIGVWSLAVPLPKLLNNIVRTLNAMQTSTTTYNQIIKCNDQPFQMPRSSSTKSNNNNEKTEVKTAAATALVKCQRR